MIGFLSGIVLYQAWKIMLLDLHTWDYQIKMYVTEPGTHTWTDSRHLIPTPVLSADRSITYRFI